MKKMSSSLSSKAINKKYNARPSSRPKMCARAKEIISQKRKWCWLSKEAFAKQDKTRPDHVICKLGPVSRVYTQLRVIGGLRSFSAVEKQKLLHNTTMCCTQSLRAYIFSRVQSSWLNNVYSVYMETILPVYTQYYVCLLDTITVILCLYWSPRTSEARTPEAETIRE